MSGPLSPNLLSNFRFGQARSETKTLQIFLESFCIHSPAHVSFYFSYGSSLFLSFLSFLEPAFLHCGVYPFLSMLPLVSPLSRQGVVLAHLDSLPPYDLVLWTDGSVPFPFGKGGSGVLANCSLGDSEATLNSSAGPVCSSFCRIHSFLYSDSRHTVSCKLFDTHVPSISTKELVLSCHARCLLSRLRCDGHSLLFSSYLSRVGRIKNPSCSASGHPCQEPLISFCTTQLRTLCAARSLATLCLSTTSGADLG